MKYLVDSQHAIRERRISSLSSSRTGADAMLARYVISLLCKGNFGAQKRDPHARVMQPRKKVPLQHLRAVKPRVSPEDLIRAFPRKGNRVQLLHPTAEIQKRGINVRLPREISCADGIAEKPRYPLGRRGQYHVIGSELQRKTNGKFVIPLRLEERRSEIFLVPLVFKRVGGQNPALFPFMLGCHRRHHGGIQPARQEHAQRNIRR